MWWCEEMLEPGECWWRFTINNPITCLCVSNMLIILSPWWLRMCVCASEVMQVDMHNKYPLHISLHLLLNVQDTAGRNVEMLLCDIWSVHFPFSCQSFLPAASNWPDNMHFCGLLRLVLCILLFGQFKPVQCKRKKVLLYIKIVFCATVLTAEILYSLEF